MKNRDIKLIKDETQELRSRYNKEKEPDLVTSDQLTCPYCLMEDASESTDKLKAGDSWKCRDCKNKFKVLRSPSHEFDMFVTEKIK